MPSYLFKDDYEPDSPYQPCGTGSTVKEACESLGGAYWDFSGQGEVVCSVGGTTKSVVSLPPLSSCPNWSGEVLPPLTITHANLLLAGVLVVWGLAYVIRLMLRFLYNR